MRDTAEVLSKVGFKIFLNVTPTVTNWAADGRAFSLILDDNPLAGELRYLAMCAGADKVIRQTSWNCQTTDEPWKSCGTRMSSAA